MSMLLFNEMKWIGGAIWWTRIYCSSSRHRFIARVARQPISDRRSLHCDRLPGHRRAPAPRQLGQGRSAARSQSAPRYPGRVTGSAARGQRRRPFGRRQLYMRGQKRRRIRRTKLPTSRLGSVALIQRGAETMRCKKIQILTRWVYSAATRLRCVATFNVCFKFTVESKGEKSWKEEEKAEFLKIILFVSIL